MFSHLDENLQPSMVDVTAKAISHRSAIARSFVKLPEELLQKLNNGDLHSPKGPVFATAIIAGTLAVKKTAELIPFCHLLVIDSCKIRINPSDGCTIQIECEVKTCSKTGVEMEALTGASLAALTVYDMCKSMSSNISIEKTELLSKRGGKNDFNKSTQ